MTGVPSLNLSAICCASLKLRGTTRWTRTDASPGAASTARGRGRMTAVRELAAASGSGSVQSSNSLRRRRGESLRTFGRSL